MADDDLEIFADAVGCLLTEAPAGEAHGVKQAVSNARFGARLAKWASMTAVQGW